MKNDSAYVYFIAFLSVALLIWIFGCSLIGGSFILHHLFGLPVYIGAFVSLVADLILLCVFYSLEEN